MLMPRIEFCIGVNGKNTRFSAGLRWGQSVFLVFCEKFVASIIFCGNFFAMKKTSGKFLHDETGAVYYNGQRVRGAYVCVELQDGRMVKLRPRRLLVPGN